MNSIVNLSEAFSMALHGMAMIAAVSEGSPVTARAIADRLGVSEAHLSKVLGRLTRSRLLKSMRGPGGGFILGRPAASIRLLDIYESVEGPLTINDCIMGTKVCCGDNCIFENLIHDLNAEFKDYLERTSLDEVKDTLKE